MNTPRSFPPVALGLCLACLASCTTPSSFWTNPVSTSNVTYGLSGGVAVIDDANHRIVLLQGTSGQVLRQQTFPLGHNFQSATVSPDGSTLFVLTSGDQPVQTKKDQLPSLTVLHLDDSLTASPLEVYSMPHPLSNLAVDPVGTYVVAWAGSKTEFAQNPNEIVIFDLTQPYSPADSAKPNPVARNIRSFGGTPQQLVYSPSLNLPANAASANTTATPRRLLFVETTRDVSIVDLTHAFDPPPASSPGAAYGRPDITVQLTSGSGGPALAPQGLVVDPNPDDGRVAFFASGDTNIYALQLLPAPAGSPNDFTPQINLTDVGGSPSDLQFVRTDAGLRVAALVPSASTAVLVEPDTSQTTRVGLPAPFTDMSLVTNVVGSSATAPNTDVALLWSTATGVTAGVALWTLGTTVGQPYRSLEVLQVNEPIQAVYDVPQPNENLKVLAAQTEYGGGDFYVLDLLQRTASPIHTTNSAALGIAPDGLRMWTYDRPTDPSLPHRDLAQVDFDSLNPVSLTTSADISSVYDIRNIDTGRSLVAIHGQGALTATVFDAISPQTTARTNVALLLEAP